MQESLQWVAGDGDADMTDAGQFARILAQRRGALAFQRGVDLHAFGRMDHPEQRLAHAARGAGHHDHPHILVAHFHPIRGLFFPYLQAVEASVETCLLLRKHFMRAFFDDPAVFHNDDLVGL